MIPRKVSVLLTLPLKAVVRDMLPCASNGEASIWMLQGDFDDDVPDTVF